MLRDRTDISPDEERIQSIKALMANNGLDALICQKPDNVLMLSGYYPTLAESFIVFLSDGSGVVIAPESDLSFAQDAWFTEIRTFSAVTPDYVLSPFNTAIPLLAEVCCEKGIAGGVVGIERSPSMMPATGPGIYTIDGSFRERFTEVLPHIECKDASDLLTEAAAVKSTREIERISITNTLAAYGFDAVKSVINLDIKEIELAVKAKYAIELEGDGRAGVRRIAVWAYCISGQRTVDSSSPYHYSSNRKLEYGDPVILNIICCADGYWTNLSRTFFVGAASPEQLYMYDSVHEAWESAFDMLGEGIKAADVDRTIQIVLSERGHGDVFLQGTGHGIGFNALDQMAKPILHPASDDTLKSDMVFSLSPATHREQFGIHISDAVLIRGNQAKVLSNIPRDVGWAICEI